MRSRSCIVITIFAGVLAIFRCGPASAASSALLGWNAPSKSRVGSSFTLRLTVESALPLHMLSLTLGFDQQSVEVLRVAAGDAVEAGGSPSSFSSTVDADGRIVLIASRVAAPGRLATITFRAVNEAPVSLLQIQAVRAVDAAGQEVAIAVPGVARFLINP